MKETSDTKVATRADIPDSDKWDLRPLFADVSSGRRILPGAADYPLLTEWKESSVGRQKSGRMPGV